MKRFSFAAGPCPIPPEVKKQVAEDVREWKGCGVSALELPFTGDEFAEILESAASDLRSLIEIPRSHKILFLQGGATAQFALVPMNLARVGWHCDYVESGYWSRRAIEEAASWWDVRVIASGAAGRVPNFDEWRRNSDAAYCHFTSNESADGLQFHEFPQGGKAPLVADMTGDFLTRPIPVEQLGLVYASALKSLGASGLTIVIVRADLLVRGSSGGIPAPFDLARQTAARSKVNTPPMLAILVAARMLRWLLEGGGISKAFLRSQERSANLYSIIDGSGFYRCDAAPDARSRVNVCFRLPDPELEESFAHEAEALGLLHLRGHKRVGGLRASFYNSTADEAVDALLEFMTNFMRRNG